MPPAPILARYVYTKHKPTLLQIAILGAKCLLKLLVTSRFFSFYLLLVFLANTMKRIQWTLTQFI